ncbi:MAG TPA: zf-HC2 domain-containing protein [Anaeromyxobacter sp.]
MTHDELRERLLELAFGELTPREAREVEEHAGSCEACRAELARLRGTRQVMAALPVEPAPERGEGILLAAAREAAEKRKERSRVSRWLWRGALVAVPVAAVIAVSLRIAGLSPREQADRDALLGESRISLAPPEVAEPPAAAPEPAPAKKKSEAAPPASAGPPAREERSRSEQRFATAPPPAPAEPAHPSPIPSPLRGEGQGEGPAQREGAERADRFAAAPAAPPPSSAADVAPSRALAKKAAPAPSAARRADGEAGAAAGAVAAPQEPDALARYEALRREGRLRVETREFPGCPSESWRRIERDPEGRIVSYAWRSEWYRIEVVYGPDGRWVDKHAFDARTGAPDPLVKFAVPRREALDLDAPTVCDR